MPLLTVKRCVRGLVMVESDHNPRLMHCACVGPSRAGIYLARVSSPPSTLSGPGVMYMYATPAGGDRYRGTGLVLRSIAADPLFLGAGRPALRRLRLAVAEERAAVGGPGLDAIELQAAPLCATHSNGLALLVDLVDARAATLVFIGITRRVIHTRNFRQKIAVFVGARVLTPANVVHHRIGIIVVHLSVGDRLGRR